jgi:hypothetical protein
MDKSFFSFKRLFWAYTISFTPFALIVGILSLLGIIPMYFNQIPYYGFIGLFIALLMIPFFGIVFSITNYLALNFGVVIYRLLHQLLKSKD